MNTKIFTKRFYTHFYEKEHMQHLEEKRYYVYEWFNTETQEVFYVGKGTKDRWKEIRPSRRSKAFLEYLKQHPDVCKGRIVQDNLTEHEAYLKETEKILEYRHKNFPIVNSDNGGKRGGAAKGEANGMYHKTHTPEAIAKIKAANIGHTKESNNNARLTQLFDINNQLICEFNCVLDLIDYLIKETNNQFTFRTMQTYIYRARNKQQLLFEKYYIKVFRKNQVNIVPNS